jgi:hypothetical protein
LNNSEQHYFEIIKDGPYKGKRLYFEDLCGLDFIFPMETYFLFKNALNHNYKIFYVTCTPNHEIKIPKKDYEFLISIIESENIYKKHKFSDEVLNLKNLQYLDITKLYDISVKSNKIGTVIIHPKLELNYYCFDFVIFIKNDFDLNSLLSVDFNFIKIKSLIEFNYENLTVEKIQKLYDFTNFLFKDNIILLEDIKKVGINSDNEILIPELTEFYKLLNLSNKYKVNTKNPFTPFDNEIEKIKRIIDIKQEELEDKNLYKKLVMSKICMQF